MGEKYSNSFCCLNVVVQRKRECFSSLFWETGGWRSNSFFPWAELEMLSPPPWTQKPPNGPVSYHPSRKGFWRERANKAFFSPWITSKLLGKIPQNRSITLANIPFFRKTWASIFSRKKIPPPTLREKGANFSLAHIWETRGGVSEWEANVFKA